MNTLGFWGDVHVEILNQCHKRQNGWLENFILRHGIIGNIAMT